MFQCDTFIPIEEKVIYEFHQLKRAGDRGSYFRGKMSSQQFNNTFICPCDTGLRLLFSSNGVFFPCP